MITDPRAATRIGLMVQSSMSFHAPLAYPETVDTAFGVRRLGRTSVTYEGGLPRVFPLPLLPCAATHPTRSDPFAQSEFSQGRTTILQLPPVASRTCLLTPSRESRSPSTVFCDPCLRLSSCDTVAVPRSCPWPGETCSSHGCVGCTQKLYWAQGCDKLWGHRLQATRCATTRFVSCERRPHMSSISVGLAHQHQISGGSHTTTIRVQGVVGGSPLPRVLAS